MIASDIAARPPLAAPALRARLVRPGGLWREVRVAQATGSTNADLVAEARRGAPPGVVLVAEEQNEGRGRLGRAWASPPRAALTFSVLLRPAGVPGAQRGWLPLLAGVAVASALRLESVDAWLKWPNDVLVGGRKVAGILAEQAGDAVVVGVGLNVSTRREELPVAEATSLLLEGAGCLDRERLLERLLGELERRYLAWVGTGVTTGPGAEAGWAGPGEAGSGGVRREYLRLCCTLDRRVRVLMPGGRVLAGAATDIDPAGRLVVAAGHGLAAVSAGDVVHVR